MGDSKVLKTEVSSDIFRQVRISAATKDQSLKDWLLEAITEKLFIEQSNPPSPAESGQSKRKKGAK